MNAHYELFSITGDVTRLHWFVSRMTNAVNVVCAKVADDNFSIAFSLKKNVLTVLYLRSQSEKLIVKNFAFFISFGD